jgi:DNA-binding NarL/FixJ family response regulator
MTQAIAVLVIAPDALVGRALVHLITETPAFSLSGQATTARQLPPIEIVPAVALVWVTRPRWSPPLTAMELADDIRPLVWRWPRLNVVFLKFDDEGDVVASAAAAIGAEGGTLASSESDLIALIRKAAHGPGVHLPTGLESWNLVPRIDPEGGSGTPVVS